MPSTTTNFHGAAEYRRLQGWLGLHCLRDCMPACKADINIVAKLKEVHNLLDNP